MDYIWLTFLLVNIVPLINTFICHYYTKKIKIRTCWPTKNIKMESNESKRFGIENHACFYLDEIIKFRGF